jgi:hypothetical protein
VPVPGTPAPRIAAERTADCSIVEIVPEGRFLTYGMGVTLRRLRDTAASRGHAIV